MKIALMLLPAVLILGGLFAGGVGLALVQSLGDFPPAGEHRFTLTHYQALLASNDPGEAPLRGGLLAADYGRGHYIYTSMVWYRELRAGVPGAYRMLANMISYGRK